jgi:chemotaxis protein CheD
MLHPAVPMERSAHPIDIFLQPGEYFVGDGSYQPRTLLGSCVSITLWHAGLRVGAMSHFLLASRSPSRLADAQLDGRYGEEAVELMLQELARQRISASECEAKLFGGGNMFPPTLQAHGEIGRRNGEAARELLRRRGIAVRSEHLFGRGHRQVIFNIGTGDVWVRQISPVSTSPDSIGNPCQPSK